MRLKILFVVLLFIFSTGHASVNSQSKKIDAYIKQEMTKYQMPGLALAVVKNGKVLKLKGYGLGHLRRTGIECRVAPALLVPASRRNRQFDSVCGRQFRNLHTYNYQTSTAVLCPGKRTAGYGIVRVQLRNGQYFDFPSLPFP